MKNIERLIGQARRRMTLQRCVDALRVALIVFGVAAAATIAIAKFAEVPYDQNTWAAASILTAIGLAVLSAIGFAFWRRPSRLDAAVQIDQRLKTRERLSSALTVGSLPQSAMGDAVVADAEASAERLDVRDAFGLRFRPNWLHTALPVAAIIALVLTPPLGEQAEQDKLASLETSLEQVKTGTQPLLEEIRVQKETAESESPEDADFFKELESALTALRDDPAPQKKLLSDLKKIEEMVKEKKASLGTADELKKQLAKLDKLDDGPAERLAEAMQEGDLEAADEELQQLADKLAKDQLSEDEKKKLAEQLEQMKEALEQAAESHQQQKSQLQQQLEQALASNDSQAAAKIAEQLQQLANQDASVASMKQMAEQLSQAAQGLQQGNSQAAQQSMAAMQEAMKQMQKNQRQAAQLQELADSLQQSRQRSNCGQCQGGGCKACMGNMSSDRFSITKNSRGEGRGAGEREEQENDTGDYESQVRGDVGPGETAFGGRIAGPNRATESQSSVIAAIQAATLEDADPIEAVDLPPRQRDVAREYFDSLREPTTPAAVGP